MVLISTKQCIDQGSAWFRLMYYTVLSNVNTPLINVEHCFD